MTKPRDPDALLSAYLAVGMEVLPDRVVDSVLDEIHRTRQRVVVRPSRTRPTSRTALAAAAIVVVVALAGAFALAGRPSPTPSLTPRASLPIVVAPSPTAGTTASTAPGIRRQEDVWIATGTMRTPRSGHTAVRLNDGRVLVAGGARGNENDTSAELYDPATGTWAATGNMARPRGGFAFGATLLSNGKVLVGDGKGAEVYDPNSGTWTATGRMAVVDPDGTGHWGLATMLRDGRALVVHDGGKAEFYDPESGSWTATRTLTPPVDIPTPVTLPDGKVLVAGGEDTARDGNRAALYDPATGAWNATGAMGSPRLEHIVVPLLDGRVLVVGGALDDQTDTSAELYDPVSGTWSATGNMLRAHTRFQATLLNDGRVLVGDVAGAELYDPATGSWSTTGSMLRQHTDASATLLLDGTVLVVGGEGAPELYIPAGVAPPSSVASQPERKPSGVWMATGSMGKPRSGQEAVRLLDGRVLVVGGAKGDAADTSAELYDPVSGTWSATGNMLRAPRFPATLLLDGRVLVADVDHPDADDPIVGAELYDPASGTWTATGKMVRGDFSTATLLRDGTVLARGNTGSELYHPDSGTWTATVSRPAQRHSHAAILLADGKVLVAGGHVDGDTATDSAELYDPDTGSWTPIAKMHVKREVIDAFLQPDGRVLVIGSARAAPQSAETYDPETGAWTAIGDVSWGGDRESHTLLGDGTVLMAGGGTGNDLAALYDPSSGSISTVAPMLRSHRVAPATLLVDGTVLVAGSTDCLDGVCIASGSAELYVPAGVSPPPLPSFPIPSPPVIPTPTPIPTPFPAKAGPVPPDARTWTVRVVNKSSEPATLFVSEETKTGTLGRLVGSVTPNVVPPGATVEVTFRLPAKGKDWAIFVSARPDDGGLVGSRDVPLPGYIYIGPEGQVGWVSP